MANIETTAVVATETASLNQWGMTEEQLAEFRANTAKAQQEMARRGEEWNRANPEAAARGERYGVIGRTDPKRLAEFFGKGKGDPLSEQVWAEILAERQRERDEAERLYAEEENEMMTLETTITSVNQPGENDERVAALEAEVATLKAQLQREGQGNRDTDWFGSRERYGVTGRTNPQRIAEILANRKPSEYVDRVWDGILAEREREREEADREWRQEQIEQSLNAEGAA